MGEQQTGHPVEQDQRVVGGVELELPQRSQQRRGAPIGAQAPQRLGLGGKAVARQRPQPAGGHINHEVAHADRDDRRQALECLGGLTRGQLARPSAQHLQRRELLLVRNLKQLLKTVALLGGGIGERAMQPGGGAVTRRGDRPGQHAGTGQQHLGLDQPSSRQIEQDAGTLGGRPRPRIQPGRQLRVRGGLGEVAVAVLALDLPGVLAVRRLARGVVDQAARIDAQLLGDPCSDDLGHLGRPGQERAQEPHGAQLHGEAKTVVLAAAAIDQHPVAIVEVKEPLQLRRRRRLGIAAVRGPVLSAQEINRHGRSAPGRPAAHHGSPSRPSAGLPSTVTAGAGRGGRCRYRLVRGIPVFVTISAIVSPWSRRCAAYASLSWSISTGRPTRRPFAVAT
ncbi:MAG TPA: hypothetical protein VF897_22065, partial [Roseiflexaceae bacterium]